MRRITQEKAAVIKILNMRPTERLEKGIPKTDKELADMIGVSFHVVRDTRRELGLWTERLKAQEEADKQKLVQHGSPLWESIMDGRVKQASRLPVSIDGDGDVEGAEQELEQVMENLFRLSKKSSAAAKIWLQAKGLFVEKSEIRHGITADDITRQQLEAARELREQGYTGISEEPAELEILHDELGVDPGQIEEEGDQVDTVALPAGYFRDNSIV